MTGGRGPTAGSKTARLPTRILVPVANPSTAGELIRIGCALLDPRAGQLSALGIVEVPEGMALSEGATRARTARRLIQRVLDFAPAGRTIQPMVRIGRRAAEGILEVARDQEADLIMFGWAGRMPDAATGSAAGLAGLDSAAGSGSAEAARGAATGSAAGLAGLDSAAGSVRPWVFSHTIDDVVRTAPCDIAVLKQRGGGEFRHILVPVRGGPHAELALRFADAIARATGARLTVLHVLPPGVVPTVRARAERALAAFVAQHASGPAAAEVREADDVRAAILKEAESADLIVMGASAADPDPTATDRDPTATDRDPPAIGAHPPAAGSNAPAQAHLFGELPEWVATRAQPSVMVVRTREPLSRRTFDRLSQGADTLAAADRAAEDALSVPARVERWFGESNFHHGEFGDLDRLVRLKEQQRVTISLVLPTLNEAETIGPIVRAARRDLMEQVPLIDELLVIDSASSDATVAIAASEGARVVAHPDVLAHHGSFVGKGEALWKSLFETSGDLIVWADTDVRNWHPRMAYGTLGPLLEEPRIQYVKGYYQRPIVEDGVLKEGGGGRVTELVARPLINLLWPELSGLIQPLAGEYAGRRSMLEAIPFFTGYAVEIGHLIDIVERAGLAGLGQVDLERRVHRNQELEGLSRMSFVILAAVIKRLEERRRARLFADLGSTMQLPRFKDGELGLEVIELADHERPPMLQIREYVQRRASLGVSR